MSDKRLLAAWQDTVRDILPLIEQEIEVRLRKGKNNHAANRTQGTKKMVAAVFPHLASRAQDPFGHDHIVIMNVTQNENGEYMAAAYQALMEATPTINAIAMNKLARRVRDLGYDIVEDKYAWTIKGVSKDVEDYLSKQSTKIKKEEARLAEKKNLVPSAKLRRIIASEVRPGKVTLTEDQLREHTIRDLVSGCPGEYEHLEALKQSALRQACQKSEFYDNRALAKTLVETVARSILSCESVTTKEEIIQTANKWSLGRVTPEEIEHAYNAVDLFKRNDGVMMKEELRRELWIAAYIEEQRGKYLPLGRMKPDSEAKPIHEDYEAIDQEQRRAAQCILSSRDGVIILRGIAGAGKSRSIAHVANAMRGKVLVAALSGVATEELKGKAIETQCKAFENATTIQRLVQYRDGAERMRDGLLIIDEAGLAGTNQLQEAMLLAKEYNARILLVGDTKQNTSPSSGDSLRIVENYTNISIAEISNVTRQRQTMHKQATKLMASGRFFDALKLYDEAGCIKEVKEAKRISTIINIFMSFVNKGEIPQILAGTWTDIDTITRAVRNALKQEGKLPHSGQEITTYRSKALTNAKKELAQSYHLGNVVSFHRHTGPFRQGEVWEVVETKENTVRLRNKAGKDEVLNPKKQAIHLDICTKEKGEYAKGDKIILKANYTQNLKNGMVFEIADVDTSGRITLNNGKVLGEEYRHFNHAWAMTNFASQGITAKHIIESVDPKAVQSQLKGTYVPKTRHKETYTIVCSNWKSHAQMLEKNRGREAVTERIWRNIKGIEQIGPKDTKDIAKAKKSSNRARLRNRISKLVSVVKVRNIINQYSMLDRKREKDRYQ